MFMVWIPPTSALEPLPFAEGVLVIVMLGTTTLASMTAAIVTPSFPREFHSGGWEVFPIGAMMCAQDRAHIHYLCRLLPRSTFNRLTNIILET